jgi:phosphoenolpyruvate synthase/pyruvate phosphate dikinase
VDPGDAVPAAPRTRDPRIVRAHERRTRHRRRSALIGDREDLPDASFAGQQETFLNVRGRDALLKCVHEVFASLFNDRAIAYRVHQGFAHDQVALSAGIQYMVRSDLGASGVMFTLDTDSASATSSSSHLRTVSAKRSYKAP